MRRPRPLLLLGAASLAACASQPPTTPAAPAAERCTATTGPTAPSPRAPAEKPPLDAALAYLDAASRRDPSALTDLVASDAAVFESGGDEGTFTQYHAHHLPPELEQFTRFEIRPDEAGTRSWVADDRSLAVVAVPMAYDIALRDGRTLASQGTVTFVLRPAEEGWTIVHLHGSSRPRRAPRHDGGESRGHGHGS